MKKWTIAADGYENGAWRMRVRCPAEFNDAVTRSRFMEDACNQSDTTAIERVTTRLENAAEKCFKYCFLIPWLAFVTGCAVGMVIMHLLEK